MMRFNAQLVPPDGFWYRESDGTVIKAESLDRLVEAVRAYRTATARPVGDPERDVHAALCARHPHMVEGAAPGGCEGSPLKGEGARPVMEWVERLLNLPTPPAFLSSADWWDVRKRAETCMICPACVCWGDGGVATRNFEDALLRRWSIRAPEEVRGKACLLARDILSVVVGLRTPPPVPNAPSFCWRKWHDDTQS